MNARLIYLILIPLAFVNILFYHAGVYFMEVEPNYLQVTAIQVMANLMVAFYLVDQIKKDNFY